MSEKRVALCATCVVDQIMPEVGIAATRLLRRAGYEVSFPAGQTCCGQPFFNSGFRKEARRLARRTVDAFAGDDEDDGVSAVVIPSGSCTAMIRCEYAHLLEEEPAYYYRARRLAAKTYELSEFLVQEAGWQPAPADAAPTVTYHDSCHMQRMLGLGAEARQLLAAAGCEVVEMAESERCCGFGGLFSVRMPDVSNAMTGEKLAQAEASGGRLLVTADPGCLMQMRGLSGDGVRPEHLATVLEEVTR